MKLKPKLKPLAAAVRVSIVAMASAASAPLLAADNDVPNPPDRPVLLAQAGAAAAPAAAPVSGRIEEVIITARKDEESQQTVPVAVTALSDEALKAYAVTSVYDLSSAVPGLYVGTNSQGGAATFAIRGAKADNGTSDTVTAYVDDMPMAHTKAVANMSYDMASITTLKGPQGTFFGTSTTGGAIIFRPNKPTDTFEGYVELGVGNWGRKTFEGMVNIPINDVLQVRIAGDMVKRDGFFKNVSGFGPSEMGDEDRRSMRVSVRLKPTTALLNDTVVNYYHEDNIIQPESLIALRPRFNYPSFLGFQIPVDYAFYGIKVNSSPWIVTAGPYDLYNKAENVDVANTTTYEINDNLSIKNVIGYQRVRTDSAQDNDMTVAPGGNPPGAVNGRTSYNIEYWTEEFSVDSKFWDGRLRNKTGVFFSNKKIEAGNSYVVLGHPWETSGLSAGQQTAVANFLPLGSNSYYHREFETKALYSQFAYDITDTLTATLGARYTWDEGDYSATNRQTFGFANADFGNFFAGSCVAGLANYKNSKGPFITPTMANPNPRQFDTIDPNACEGHQDYKSSAPAYSFTLENKFSDRQMAYAAFRHGYLVGGFNNQVYTPDYSGQIFLPEEVTDTEFGLKSDWDLFDRPIRTNVALFFGHYKNQQRVQNGQTSQGTTYVAVQNAGATTFYGLDLDVVYDVTDWLRLTLGYNHVKATYDNFKAPLSIPGVAGAFVDYQGKQTSQTPENILSLSGTITWPLATDKGTLKSTLSYYWRDDSFPRDAPTINCTFAGSPPYTAANPAGECKTIIDDFTEYDLLEDYAIVNFTTEWKNVMGSPFDVRFWVKNLFDKEYAVYASNQFNQNGYATMNFGNPREYGLNVRYNF